MSFEVESIKLESFFLVILLKILNTINMVIIFIKFEYYHYKDKINLIR